MIEYRKIILVHKVNTLKVKHFKIQVSVVFLMKNTVLYFSVGYLVVIWLLYILATYTV